MKIVAADIGKQSDFTVAAVVLGSPTVPREYHVSKLDRWRGIRYGDTVGKLVALAARHPDATIAVDAGGVGRPVLDLVRDALPGRKVYGIISTGGRNVNAGQEPGDVCVPKGDLIGCLQVLLQAKRLTYSPSLPLVRELQGEFQRFEMKTTKALNLTYEAAGGSHDDIVAALALACWVGEQAPQPLTDERIRNAVLTVYPKPAEVKKPRTRMEALALDFPEMFGE